MICANAATIDATCMSPTLNFCLEILRLKCSNAIEIRNGHFLPETATFATITVQSMVWRWGLKLLPGLCIQLAAMEINTLGVCLTTRLRTLFQILWLSSNVCVFFYCWMFTFHTYVS